MRAKRSSEGQSYAEFVVARAILMPIMLMLPTVANLLSAQTEAHKAARFVAWERTAYPASEQKQDTTLAGQVQEKFLQHSESSFVPGSGSAFVAPWRDWGSPAYGAEANLQGQILDFEDRVVVVSDAPESATAGIPNASSRLDGVGGRGNSDDAIQLETMHKTRLSIPLNEESSLFKTTKVTSVWFQERTPDEDSGVPEDHIAGRNRFNVSSSASLVSDSWIPVNEEMLFDRVSDLSTPTRAGMRLVERPVSDTIRLLGFEEIDERMYRGENPNDAFEMVDAEQSLILPERLKQYE